MNIKWFLWCSGSKPPYKIKTVKSIQIIPGKSTKFWTPVPNHSKPTSIHHLPFVILCRFWVCMQFPPWGFGMVQYGTSIWHDRQRLTDMWFEMVLIWPVNGCQRASTRLPSTSNAIKSHHMQVSLACTGSHMLAHRDSKKKLKSSEPIAT